MRDARDPSDNPDAVAADPLADDERRRTAKLGQLRRIGAARLPRLFRPRNRRGRGK